MVVWCGGSQAAGDSQGYVLQHWLPVQLQISLAGERTLRHPRVEGFIRRLSPQRSAKGLSWQPQHSGNPQQQVRISPWGFAPGEQSCAGAVGICTQVTAGGRCCDSLKGPSAAHANIWSRASIPQCFHPYLSASCVEHRGSPSSDSPWSGVGGTRWALGRSQPCKLRAHREQREWVQRGRHWVW